MIIEEFYFRKKYYIYLLSFYFYRIRVLREAKYICRRRERSKSCSINFQSWGSDKLSNNLNSISKWNPNRLVFPISIAQFFYARLRSSTVSSLSPFSSLPLDPPITFMHLFNFSFQFVIFCSSFYFPPKLISNLTYKSRIVHSLGYPNFSGAKIRHERYLDDGWEQGRRVEMFENR